MSEIRIPQWAPVDQLQIYYVGDAGNASNDGKSLETPFNSLATAISAVNGQTPSATNRFAIVFIGGFRAIGNFTPPAYTVIYGLDGAEIVGTLTMDNPDSKVIMDKYTGPSSGTYGIHRGVSATGNAFVEIHGEANIGDFRPISNGTTAGSFFVAINKMVASPSAQVWYAVVENLGTGSNLYVKVNSLDASGGTANVVRPGAGNTYCEFGEVKSTSGAFIYTQGGDTGKAYIKVQDVDASGANLTNLATATPEIHLEAQKALGAITGVTSNLFMNIGEGPTASKTVTYSDGNLNASNDIAAGGDISTPTGTVTAKSGLIRNSSAAATMEVYGAGGGTYWSQNHLYSDSTFFRGAGVRISKQGGSGQWWAGVQYNAGGQYRIVYSAGTNPETGNTSCIQCLTNGDVRLPNIGSIASTTGYNALYASVSLGLVKRFTSSIKYKENVQDMGDTSWLYQLRPVTFTSKVKGDDTMPQYGLISEEVATVAPTIGTDDTVHYEQLISVLINEVKKLNDRITALEGI